MHAHAPGCGAHRFAQRHVQVTRDAAVNRHLGHGHAADAVDAPLRRQHSHGAPALRDLQLRPRRAVVRTLHLLDAVQPEAVATDLGRLARLHADVVFTLKAADHRDAHNEHRHPQVGQQHAVVTARLRRQSLHHAGGRVSAQALDQIDQRARSHPHGQPQAQAGHRFPLLQEQRRQQRGGQAHPQRPAQAPRQVTHRGLPPARQRADAHEKKRRCHQWHKHGIEIRRADRQLALPQRVNHQRVQGAQQDSRGSHQQQHVVGQQHGFARHRLKVGGSARTLKRRRAPGQQRQRTAHHQRQKKQDENAARRVRGKGMDRAQHARAHDEGAQQRE